MSVKQTNIGHPFLFLIIYMLMASIYTLKHLQLSVQRKQIWLRILHVNDRENEGESKTGQRYMQLWAQRQ
jgi:hypothetical protein